MLSVGKLAKRFGLSRTTLLYYDRIGLLRPTARSESGYRLYGDAEVERLSQICSYRRAGLTLEQIGRMLSSPGVPDEGILSARLAELDREIGALRIQQRAILGILESLGSTSSISAIDKNAWVEILRSSGLSEEDMVRWHEQFERDAPDAPFLSRRARRAIATMRLPARTKQPRIASDPVRVRPITTPLRHGFRTPESLPRPRRVSLQSFILLSAEGIHARLER